MAALAVALIALGTTAAAQPAPKRRVAVLEYRAGSAALQGIARRVVRAMGKRTSLELLGPDQARAVFGDHLEHSLVKCAGDAACVARLGKRMRAAEVVLVGVSELGDVILTMQRIEVAAEQVRARVADSLGDGAEPSDVQLDGYLERLLPPSDFLRFGVIDIVANVAGAAVTVGAVPRGVTPLAPLRLRAPATYEIRVERAGYVPYRTRVALPPDGEMKVEASLARPGGAAWYQRWYVLAGLGAVVAGAGATAVYFATREPAGDGNIGVTGGVE